jgi:hypothetical protein
VADTTIKTKNNNKPFTKKENKMEYKVKSPKFQDIITKTVRITAAAGDLGTISGANLVISAADIHADLATADVLVATNVSAGETCTHVVASGDLTIDSTTAITAASIIDLVIKLP